MYDPLPIELAMHAQYAKFMPQLPPTSSWLPNCTRAYLEYDGLTGDYVERDPATGEIVGSGVLDDREIKREAA